jgi:hypothetical protein
MIKLKIFFFSFLSLLFFSFFVSCGDDDQPGGGNNNGGNLPTINMKVNALYTMSIDSIQNNGNVSPTPYHAIHTYLAQGTYFGQSNAFQIRVVTEDSASHSPLSTDTFYVRYDGGKFYQYGIVLLLNPNAAPTWDVIADFNVSQGTQWTIADSIPISFIPGGYAKIKSKVAEKTSFQTNAWGNSTVSCYRAEITGDIYVATLLLGTVYVDYYIGDSNPVTNPPGLVRLKLRPVNITGYQSGGLDQKMLHWTLP